MTEFRPYDPRTEFQQAVDAVEAFLASKPTMTLAECLDWVESEMIARQRPPAPQAKRETVGMEERLAELSE